MAMLLFLPALTMMNLFHTKRTICSFTRVPRTKEGLIYTSNEILCIVGLVIYRCSYLAERTNLLPYPYQLQNLRSCEQQLCVIEHVITVDVLLFWGLPGRHITFRMDISVDIFSFIINSVLKSYYRYVLLCQVSNEIESSLA